MIRVLHAECTRNECRGVVKYASCVSKRVFAGIMALGLRVCSSVNVLPLLHVCMFVLFLPIFAKPRSRDTRAPKAAIKRQYQLSPNHRYHPYSLLHHTR